MAPEDAALDRLLGALLPEAAVLPSPVALRRHLRRLRQADLERGDVVVVDGWVLPRTEARLCALVAVAGS